jgi:hypothetical protein
MQAAGNFTLTCIVIVVNIKLLISSFEMTTVLLFFVVASIAVYMVSFWFITYYSAVTDDYHIFIELFINPVTYVLLAFFMYSYVLVDSGMRFTSVEVNMIMERRKERALYEAKIKEFGMRKRDTVIKTRINTIKSKLHFLANLYYLSRPRLCILRRGWQRQDYHRVAHK